MTVEVTQGLLRAAVAERQLLRERGAAAGALEWNRLRIVALQWELSRALLVRYAPPVRAAA
jgi:hypothetical protein